MDSVVYSFNGQNDIDFNYLDIADNVKASILQVVDDFSISFWINIDPDSNSAYIFSFEMGTSPYFNLFETSRSRSQFYYYRDQIPGESGDQGVNTRVVLSFFYDREIFVDGLRDGEWHFITLNIDYPIATLVVDGYVIFPTGGNYRDITDVQVGLGTPPADPGYHVMPAPILVKTPEQVDAIDGHIGGSARGNQFTLDGQMRQLVLSNLLETDSYNCLASCGNSIFSVDPAAPFTTFYQPVKRFYEFSGSFSPEGYTDFLQTLVYSSNGFLPVEPPPGTEGEKETRIIRLQVKLKHNYYH